MPRSKNHTRRVARSRPRGIMQLNPEGYGFVRTSEGEFFVPHAKLGGAFDGDLVEVAPLPANASKDRSHEGFGGGRYGHKPAARVVSVIERAHEVVVGRFEAAEPFGVVVPLDPHIPYDIFTQLSEAPDVEDGAIVRVRIAQFPSRNSAATGHIEEVLEHVDGLDEGVDAVVARHKFETAFSDAALAEARGASLDEVGALASGYRDLRERFVFTIDPDDARDFDDALSIEQVEDQGRLLWRIGVHIADVGEYIREGAILDKEAYQRGTSVYFVDRVLPMLPEAISNGICSLNAGQDRFALSCVMEINPRGQVVTAEISESIINVERRFTYDTVNDILQTQEFAEDPSYVDTFNDMRALAKTLYNNRIERGALEFDLPESKVVLDDAGHPVDIVVRQRGEAEQIIEEFMILANETVAAYFFRRRMPFIYRVHEEPEPEKRDAFLQYIQRLGIVFPGGPEREFTAKDMQWILAKAEEKGCAEIVSMMMLRTMNHAYYTTKKTSHFGLASRHYTHFTSPIRRYSDLSIHRLIKEYLQSGGRLNEHRIQHYDKRFIDASEQASSCERNAEEAERASVDLKIAEYMLPFVGAEYQAQIVSVTSFGFFVRLENTVEGLVHISTLVDDYYNYDADSLSLIGEHSGRSFKLGQKVAVVLDAVNMKDSTIDFVLKENDRPNRITITSEQHPKKPAQVTATARKQKTAARTAARKPSASKKSSSKKRKTHRGSKNNSRKPKSKA